MLKTGTAKWTAAVGDAAVDDQTTTQTTNSSTLDTRTSHDCAELEALRRIYGQICAIRYNHAQVVAENAAKRAEVCIILQWYSLTCPLFYTDLLS